MEKKHLHPGAKWSFRIGTYFILFFLGIFFSFWIIAPIVFIAGEYMGTGAAVLAGFFSFFVYIALIIIIGEIYARMAYNRWFYEFTDSGIRIERGVIWKRYSYVPYERVQNVDISRGILARMLGFSSLIVQTAGYSATPYSEGYLPAVGIEEAEELRAYLMKIISRKKR